MRSFRINCSKIKCEADFHILFESLGITPDYYGKNLNALWDVLTTDLVEPTTFIFENHSEFLQVNEVDFDKILNTFKEAESERQNEIIIILS